jgi:hypothetical protein
MRSMVEGAAQTLTGRPSQSCSFNPAERFVEVI